MRFPWVISLVFLALALPAAAGPEYDRARRNSALARLALDAAERRLTEAEAEGDRLRLEMDGVRDKQRDLDRQEDRLTQIRRELPDLLRVEEAKLPELDLASRVAQADLIKLSGPLREAIERAKATLAVVKEIRVKYAKQIEASEPYQHAVIAAAVAGKHLSATQRASINRIRASQPYKAAADAHRQARARQSELKRDAEAATADRVAAATAVIETESAIVRIENEALASDESLTAAKADARKAELAFQAVLEQFERDLPRQPDMAEALAKHSAAQRGAEVMDAKVESQQAKLNSANSAAAAVRTGIADLKEQQLKVEADLQASRREADALTRHLDRLRKALAANIEAVAAARRDADIADRRYRSAKAAEAIAERSGE